MPDLRFRIDRVAPVACSLAPQLGFQIRIENSMPEVIHSILLRCTIQVEATKRRYSPGEQDRLRDLFGDASRWGETLHSLLWSNTSLVVPAFTGSIAIEVPAPCSLDYTLAISKYLNAMDSQDVPVSILFSGTVFYDPGSGLYQAQQIPWDRQAEFRMPAGLWRGLIDTYYPRKAWLCLPRETFERLRCYQAEHELGTIEEVLDALLPHAEGVAR
jgi:hypothetical protein